MARAPIVEALLDFRFHPPLPSDSPVFVRFREIIQESYPEAKEKRVAVTGIELSSQAPSHLLQRGEEVKGYMYSKPQRGQTVQLDLDGFTFNQLKPYDCWENFSGEAKRWWSRLAPLLGGARIVRIGIRYINRLELPLPFKSFDEYILTSAHLPLGSSLSMSEFLVRMVIPNQALECVAVVHEKTLPPADGKLPLVFDIDVIRKLNLDCKEKSIWDIIEGMKKFENKIFFDSITARTVKLCQ